jgi:hypothetical protein
VPRHLYSGNVITPQRLAIYESVIGHPDVPPIAPIANETTTAYIQRLFAELATRCGDSPFIVELTPLDRPEYRYEYDDPSMLDENGIGIAFSTSNPNVLDISEFDESMRTHDPLLVANLVHAFGLATAFTFDAFTPTTTIEACDWHLFHGDARDWWDDIRAEIAGNERPYNGVSRKEVKTYIKDFGLRTPGNIRKRAGAHYARLVKSRERLSADEMAARIAELPTLERSLATAFTRATQALEPISEALHCELTAYDRALFTNNSAPFASPGLIVESTGDAQFICEIIDEIYQEAAQGDGFGLNYVLTLDASQASVDRFLSTIKRFETAANIVDTLSIDVATYNEAHV